MVFGGKPGESIEAEKARYRRKLEDWRAMGFDVSALEVLLETDFEKFKERRFELMRSQIHGAPARAAAPQPPAQHPAQIAPPPAAREPPLPPAAARRPGLHSHFVQRAPEAPAAAPGEPSRPEHPHSEMRYPAARRRAPGHEVRTFSIAVERPDAPRGISVGGEERPPPAPRPVPRKVKRAPPARSEPPARPRRRPEPPEEMVHVVEAEEDGPPAGETGARDGEGEPPEDGPSGGEDHPDEPEGEEPRPYLGYFTPASRVPMKRAERQARERGGGALRREGGAPPVVKKRLKKVAVRPRPGPPPRKRPWGPAAAALVLVLIVSGLAGYYYLAPRTALSARADFPASAEAGALVSFDGARSTTTGKGIDRYDWNFGDDARASGRRVTHFYQDAGNYTVTLTVRDQDGTGSAPRRSLIRISPLSVTVPARMIDERAGYNVNGSAVVSNPDTYLYKVNVGTRQLAVTEVRLNFNGTLTQWTRAQLRAEDGFGQNHSALHTTSSEDLALDGKAVTDIMTLQLSGDLEYDEDSYTDAATAGVFQARSRARTTLRFSALAGPTSLNSTDTLRSHPGVAGVTAQFQPEDVFRGRTFAQSEGPSEGEHRSGNVTYYWSRMGVRNVGGYPSLGLNLTAESAFLERNGFSEFFMNVWISGSASLPTSTLVHVKGRSGDNSYSTEHLATMTSFKAGTGAVDASPQAFDPSPLQPGLFHSPFNDVPAAGSGNDSLRFTPEQAQQEASARDGTFRDFLSQNPRSYAVAAKYYEGQFGPGSATWNLTFSWPNATSSYWVNVTRDLLQQYTVSGAFGGGLGQVRTAEAGFSRLLTMASAEGRMQADPETARVFFQNGAVGWAGGTSLELEADPSYPGINLASLFASTERAGYGIMLSRGADTSAFSMDTGQMMYFYTHSAS
jgi:PKD repeat protein